MFHTLAWSAADLLVGGANANRSEPAWHQVYRALQHGEAYNACKTRTIVSRFPPEIQDFANQFVIAKEAREQADYDPFHRFLKSEVLQAIENAEAVIRGFEKSTEKDRRAFAALVLFRRRG